MKLYKFLKVMAYFDQSPLVWGGLFVTIILMSIYIGDDNKLARDLLLILAGSVAPRIRTGKKDDNSKA